MLCLSTGGAGRERDLSRGAGAAVEEGENSASFFLGIAGSGETGDVLASRLFSQGRRFMPVCKEHSVLPKLFNRLRTGSCLGDTTSEQSWEHCSLDRDDVQRLDS